MLYLECNLIIILHRASALIVHFGGGPRARGEDRKSIAPDFLQCAQDLVFVSFGGMLVHELPAYFQLHNGRMGNKSVVGVFK
jgi:hypothetical protein